MSHILKDNSEKEPEIGEPITADVYRFNPSTDAEAHLQTYCVPYRHRMSVFTLLREIYETQDPTLAFRNQQCGRGICGTCRLRIGINGKSVKSCNIPLNPGSQVVILPANSSKVIRDLVVEF